MRSKLIHLLNVLLLMVVCSRTGGWELWDTTNGIKDAALLSGEYEDGNKGLRLDVAGHVIVDSLTRAA